MRLLEYLEVLESEENGAEKLNFATCLPRVRLAVCAHGMLAAAPGRCSKRPVAAAEPKARR